MKNIFFQVWFAPPTRVSGAGCRGAEIRATDMGMSGQAARQHQPYRVGFRRIFPMRNADRGVRIAGMYASVVSSRKQIRKSLSFNIVTDVTDVLRMVLRIKFLITNDVTDVTDLKRNMLARADMVDRVDMVDIADRVDGMDGK